MSKEAVQRARTITQHPLLEDWCLIYEDSMRDFNLDVTLQPSDVSTIFEHLAKVSGAKFKALGELSAHCKGQKGAMGVRAQYRAQGAFQSQCTRCLTQLDVPFTSIFERHWTDAKVLEGSDEEPLDLDEDEWIASGDRLDLFSHLVEEVSLNLPINPICADLAAERVSDCDAHFAKFSKLGSGELSDPELGDIDLRWGPLAALKGKIGGGGSK